MYKKLAALLAACALAAALAGCKQDAQVESALAELHTFTQELLKRIESAPTRTAGVDDAQQYFDSRRAEIEAKLASIKNVRGFQVSEETQKKMTAQLTEDVMSVAQLQNKYMSEAIRDPSLRSKLGKLIADYRALIESISKS